ncbi:MAG: ParB/RepB/Spo0J family partition protein [Gammaproteobacteria bacterium]
MVENTFDRLTKRLNEKADQKELERQEKKNEQLNKQIPIRNKNEGVLESTIQLPDGRKVHLHQIYIDPNVCRIWDGNNRIEETRLENIEELKNTIEAQGQLVPGFVRPIKDEQYQYEVIYGSRRFTACAALGRKFLAQVGDVTDKEALILMDAENNARKDLSVYEKATSYRKWLDSGIFKDRLDLATHLGVTVGWVSKIQSILKLPSEVLDTFRSRTDITVWWAVELLKIVKLGEDHKNRLIEAALKKSPKITQADEVYKYLCNYCSAESKKKEPASKKNIPPIRIKKTDGKVLCEISQESNGKVKVVFTSGVGIEEVKKRLEHAYLDEKNWEF